ncbi:hypothetical protein [Nocardioides jiangxiensis]|uniref:TnsA-like heteromeric transposase endonuclease subunit n=1 Tax=Nocardioides jiangxiensis TaxID=3064524 RepID=A0ABT9B027_9ACTN|nr:hypothetical protein [Nocardioides sp. WY-20]MDO7868164.1 hypothetical protein [Nocardioides sp. WY-20]
MSIVELAPEGLPVGDDLGWPLLPETHPLMPRSTARRGTRRMAPSMREAVGRSLTRQQTIDLIASGDLDPSRCRVIWNVNDKPVIHPIGEVKVPSLRGLRPARRIGTFKGAESRIAMLPVMRGEYATMLELESQLELAHATELVLDPKVTEIFSQPFAMVWRHRDGSVVHFPDLATIRDGRLVVHAVKPDDRAAEEWNQRLFALVGETLGFGHIEFELLGSMSKQRQINLKRLAQYRHPNPTLYNWTQVVRPHRPRTIGGFYGIVRRHLGLEGIDFPAPGCPSLVGLHAACFAVARGFASLDLNEPISLHAALHWAETGGAA